MLDPTFSVIPPTSPPGKPQAVDAQLAAIATLLGLDDPDQATYKANLETIFSLTITHGGTSMRPSRILTLGPGPRQASQVLKVGKSESQFVVWDPANTAFVAGTTITSVVLELTVSPPVDSHEFTVLEADQGVPSDFLSTDTYAGTVDPVTGNKSGILALDNTDIFNVLCIPPDKRSAADPVSWGMIRRQRCFVQALPYVVARGGRC